MYLRVIEVVAGCLALAALANCVALPGTREVQAPYDSYVCYDASFAECASRPQLSNANRFRARTYGQYFVGDSATIRDIRAGITKASSDNKYECKSGKIPYTQALAQKERAAVIFVSPMLLDQIAEQIIKLNKIRNACLRTLEAYNFQMNILGAQDQQSAAQKTVQYLTAQIEYLNISPYTSGSYAVNLPLTTAQANQFGLPTSAVGQNIADVLQGQRNSITDLSEQLRAKTKTQTLDIEYRQQFDDAQSAIDAQLREIAAELVELDKALVADLSGNTEQRYYENGALVQKGSTVLLVAR